MKSDLEGHIQAFRQDYLENPQGQKHLAIAEAETEDVKKVFGEIWRKYEGGPDILDAEYIMPPSLDELLGLDNDDDWPPTI